jgi:hypothetical protein
VHTLPLPKVQTDVNPNTQQESSSKVESSIPQMPTVTRDSGLETLDSVGGNPNPDLHNRTTRIIYQEFRIPDLKTRTPNGQSGMPTLRHRARRILRAIPCRLR